jgi:hypothetical protein
MTNLRQHGGRSPRRRPEVPEVPEVEDPAGEPIGWVLDPEVTMPRKIDRDGLRRLVDQGAQLVEVLPAHEYAEDHLPGALNLPLRRLERQATEVLDRHRAVVVYCWDSA